MQFHHDRGSRVTVLEAAAETQAPKKNAELQRLKHKGWVVAQRKVRADSGLS